MNENANERNQEVDEGGQPTQTLPAGGQSSGGDLTSLQAKLDQVLKEQVDLKEAYRTVQGEMNKGTKKVESRVTEIEKALRLKEKGLDDDEIMHRLKVDALYDNRGTASEPVVQTPVATARADTYMDEATRVVQDAGLSDTDPEVVRLMLARARPEEYYKLSIRKLKAPAPEGAGAQPMRPEGDTRQDANSLMAAYQKEALKVRGNIQQISALQAKYRNEARRLGFVLNL